jgi:uroporphyrinogen III methyltransferase/synthase
MSKVYLVGAGPGDPELLTLKAKRLLEQADSVLYDHLASPELLDLAPPGAERLYVGKKKSDHPVSQEEICGLLVERGRRGWNVVRLKGGPFEVVPGVTSPLGIAAYTGVPLTHRDHTSVVTFISGHDVANIDWSKVGTSETLVIFMGLSQFDEIARRILAAGRAPGTPAMAVRWGTRPVQETIAGTLETLPQSIHERGMKPPATIIVGEVVRLREKLNWFERLPLFGQTVVVTRARDQAAALAAPLRQLGAEVVELPTIGTEPASDYGALDRAIAHLGSYDWLIFTSANGVRYFLERLDTSPFDARALRGKICAIGPATRDALRQVQLKVDVMAEQYVAEGLLAALADYPMPGARILIARAAVARDILPKELAARGARVDVVEAYRTVAPADLAFRAAEVLAQRPDWITFTSSSTAENLIDAVGPEALAYTKAASIGPVTSATLRRHNIDVGVEASPYTVAGVVDAILRAAII